MRHVAARRHGGIGNLNVQAVLPCRGDNHLLKLFNAVKIGVLRRHGNPVRDGPAVDALFPELALAIQHNLGAAVHGEAAPDMIALIVFLQSDLGPGKLNGVSAVPEIKVHIGSQEFFADLDDVGAVLNGAILSSRCGGFVCSRCQSRSGQGQRQRQKRRSP